jgi:hypothetical protein
MTEPFSSEFRFVESCIALATRGIARYDAMLKKARLTQRQRARFETWRTAEQLWLHSNEAKRATMLAENFDVIRWTAFGEYEIVALDPAKPILRDAVTLVHRDWTAYRTPGNARAHSIRGWYETGAREQIITPKGA